MDPETVKLLAQYTLPTVAVAEAGAIIYLFKALMASHAATLDMATKILPVAEKLATGMEALERIDARRDA